ncbi:MAG: hypothetical protein CUN55_09365, partial [Phototrophicales bacterium]
MQRKVALFLMMLIFAASIRQSSHLSLVRAQEDDDPYGADWFGEGIMYEVFVRSFRDSDGDGVGDLRGVIEGLDYIQGLGANIIWLMPIHPTTTYHGYDVTDYYGINPDYGTMEDLQALIAEVHRRDMYIIMDYIANHTSNAHPFFIDSFGNPESEYSDFYMWTNEEQTEYRSFANARYLPRINYDSAQAREYMINVATYWLDPNGDGDTSDGFDGLRCDVATGPPFDFWEELRASMLLVNPDAVLLAEAWLRNGLELKTFVESGTAFNAIFDFPTYHTAAGDHDVNGDGIFSGAISGDFLELPINGAQRLYPVGAHLVRFANNHDTNRVMSEVEGDLARAKAVAVWLLTLPGTPMIYYGEEIGMFGSKGTGPRVYDEFRREPFDWYASEDGEGMTTWFRTGDRYNAPFDGISVEEEDLEPDSLLNHYRALGALHRTIPAFYRDEGVGKVELSEEGIDLYAIYRGNPEEGLYYIVINFGTSPVTATFIA